MAEKANLFKGKGVVKHSEEINEMDVDGAMGNHLPQEVIMEIFSRLPVRPLFRFKCLSKFWMAVISEPNFVRKHLNHARKNQNSQKIRFVNRNLSLQYCSSLTSASSAVQLQPVEDVQQFYWLSSDKTTHCQIHCCFDGLALVGVNECDFGGHIKLLLWNPSTRESIVLPHNDSLIESKFACGLGYDSTSDCYKILKIGHQSSSEILSLKSGSWREIDKHSSGISYLPLSTTDSLAFVHGAFHWLGLSQKSVVSFDISNEEYAEIPLPDGMFTVSDFSYGVSELGGMLCVHTQLSFKSHSSKVWVLKDYGVQKSWNQLLNIQSTFVYSVYSMIPKYMFSDGEVLLYCRYFGYVGGFKESKQSSTLWFRSISKDVDDGFVYTESLISPKLLT